MPDADLTSLLNQLRLGDMREEASNQLAALVWNNAYRLAQLQIGERFRRRFGATDIANAAIRSGISEVEKRSIPSPNREWFEGLLRKIISRHVKDAIRHETAQKRDVRREDGEDIELPDHNTDSLEAAQQAIERELRKEIEALASDEPTDERRLIAFRTIGNYTATEIRDELARTLCAGGRPPALRTIQICMRQSSERIQNELQARGFV